MRRDQSSGPDRVIGNWGVEGEASFQIAARSNACYTLVTITGDTIPASGAVTVTSTTVSIPSTDGASLMGWLGGVYGTLTRVSPTQKTFTRAEAGDPTWIGKAPFVVDLSGRENGTRIICVGTNNRTNAAKIQEDIAALVDAIPTAEKRFLIITPTTGGSIEPGVPTEEGIGSPEQTAVMALEDWAAARYGDRVLRVRPWSWQFATGSADDQADVAAGTVPRSQREDPIHWGTALNAEIAAWIINEIERRAW
ncbi:hypothetical protein ACFSM0_17095 [Rhodobacter lacus]|uniref:SGNH hydrolase-type esterase domain-containing protein n=1 Tax=Rhodobacter lacus TaxID=1641972 RepID=A0ABW5AER9_9RHOB